MTTRMASPWLTTGMVTCVLSTARTLRARDDRPEEERIRVRRRAELALTGALPGSGLGISVRNGLELFTQVMR